MKKKIEVNVICGERLLFEEKNVEEDENIIIRKMITLHREKVKKFYILLRYKNTVRFINVDIINKQVKREEQMYVSFDDRFKSLFVLYNKKLLYNWDDERDFLSTMKKYISDVENEVW